MPEQTEIKRPYTPADFRQQPLMCYYEVTQACDLVCQHCRASAQESPAEGELTHGQSVDLIRQIASFDRPPMFVFTGGDPLKRSDLFDLIRVATEHGLSVAVTPSATPLATGEAFERLKNAGVRRLGISLDGADPVTHDAFRGWCGSFDRTLEMLATARSLGFAVQVNTTVCRRNVGQLDNIAALLTDQGIAMWSVFFLVPVGRGMEQDRITPQEYEIVFAKLWKYSQSQPYGIKTTEAPHYRRYVLEHGGDPLAPAAVRGEKDHRHATHQRGHRAPLGITDGKGVMFVSHCGEIYPAGFLPLVCGRFPQDSVVDTYRDHPVFQSLQDPDRLKGNCGLCEYRHVCGGSRSRAYAVTGDPLATEPDCVYVPRPQRPPVMP